MNRPNEPWFMPSGRRKCANAAANCWLYEELLCTMGRNFENSRAKFLPNSGVRALYNILFAIGLLVSAPYYFARMLRRGNWQNGFGQRFGAYDSKFKQAITNRHTLWMHAV